MLQQRLPLAGCFLRGHGRSIMAETRLPANKYLQLAKEAAEIVINSGKYAIDTPFRDVFGSQDLKGNKEAIMYRHYTFEMLKHHIASYSNGVESQAPAPNPCASKVFHLPGW